MSHLVRNRATRRALRLPAALACAAVAWCLLAGAPACASEPAAAILADGVAEAAQTRKVACPIWLDNNVPLVIEELAPEWGFVEEGQVLARLRSMVLEEDRAQAEAALRAAAAEADRTEQAAAAQLAQLRANVAAAQAALTEAKDRLAALEAGPTPAEVRELELCVRENSLQQERARAQLQVDLELAAAGLCAQAELAQARGEAEHYAAEASYLKALQQERAARADSPAVRKARAQMRQAEAELDLARATLTVESDRQGLLCEAARIWTVGSQQRAVQNALARLEATAVRAPCSGYVLRGEMPGVPGRPLEPGLPVAGGDTIATVVDASALLVRARVREHEILAVRVGGRAVVTFHAVPGRQYEGTVHAVLGQVTEGQREEVTGIAAGTQRYGTVNVLVEAPDGSARPGMQAAVRILPGAPPAAEHDSRDAPPGTTDAHCLLLRGIVEAGRGALLRAPVNGRADWVAPAGTVVASGDLVIRFEPGLRRDSQAADRDHEQRVECTRRAAELALQLAEETVPLRVAAAQAALDVAELAREELLARPSEVERVEAANAVDDARRRLRLAEEEHGDYGDLAARGLASGMDVRRSELAVARAQAVLAQAEAERTRVLRGAPAQDVAVADADVALARTALERLQARAEADIEAARAALVAAEKDQADLCRQAEERRRTEECSDILAPCAGVVVGSMPEGAQVAQGAYAVAVAELESVQVHASLDEADYFRVAPGMRATVRVAGLPGAPFAGRVTGVREWPDPPFWVQEQADTGKRRMGKQFQVVIVPEGRFPTMLGMSAEVRVFTAEPRAGVAGTADVHERVTLEGGA